jgi:hypothetical protein
MRYYLKPRGGIWYICWTCADGSPGRASTRTRDRAEAERALARHVVEHDRPRDQRFAETTLEAVLVRYWTHHTKALADRGIVRRVIGLVCDHAPMVSLADFTIPRQEQFIREAMPNVTDGTRRRYMGVIEAAMNWSFQRGEIERQIPILVPAAVDGPGARRSRQRRSAASSPRRGVSTSAGSRCCSRPRARAAGDPAARLVTRDAGRRGLRRARPPPDEEAPGARAAGADCGEVPRGAAQRRSCHPVERSALKGHRMTIARIMARAGLDATAYSVRKGSATWLAEQDVPEWEVGRFLAHRVGSGTTERYAHHRPGYMRATREAIEALLREIAPDWLASHLPAPVAATSDAARIRRR